MKEEEKGMEEQRGREGNGWIERGEEETDNMEIEARGE